MDETLGLSNGAVFTYSRHSNHKVRCPPPTPTVSPRLCARTRERRFPVLIFLSLSDLLTLCFLSLNEKFIFVCQ